MSISRRVCCFLFARGLRTVAVLGRLNKRGMPVAAVLASSVGMFAALILSQLFKNTAFVFMIGVAFFGGPFMWIMILATHLAFRRATTRAANKQILRFRAARAVELIVWADGTYWGADLDMVGTELPYHLACGSPLALFITVCYLVWRKTRLSLK